jgi:hypothetical protein
MHGGVRKAGGLIAVTIVILRAVVRPCEGFEK